MKLSQTILAKPVKELIPCTDLPGVVYKLKQEGIRVLAMNRIRKDGHTFYTLETDKPQ